MHKVDKSAEFVFFAGIKVLVGFHDVLEDIDSVLDSFGMILADIVSTNEIDKVRFIGKLWEAIHYCFAAVQIEAPLNLHMRKEIIL